MGEEWGDESSVDFIWSVGEYNSDGVYACDTEADILSNDWLADL